MTTNGVKLPTARNVAARYVEKHVDVIRGFIAPGSVDPAVFLSALIVEGNMLPAVVDAKKLEDPRTLGAWLKACMNAAVVGLVPGAALGHCYFVPYTLHRGKAAEHVTIAWVPGYRGYLELAFRNEFLSCCSAEVVLAGEQVERGHSESGPWIKHVIPVPRGKCDRTTLVGAYCTYQTKLGGKSVVFVERDEIAAVDTRKNVWASDYKAMACKTAIRRAAKNWRVTQALAAAIMLDEQADRDEPQSTLYEEAKAEQPAIDLDSLGQFVPEEEGERA